MDIPDLVTMFREGGWAMYVVLAFGMLGLLLAFLDFVLGVATVAGRGSRAATIGVGVATVVVGLLIVGGGVGGWQHGLATMEEAITFASPEHREALRSKGAELASYPLYFGLAMSAVPLLAGFAAIVLGLIVRKNQ